MSRIDGATVFFIGAASGIGLATARKLATKGAHLALMDIQPLEAAMGAVMAARRFDTQQVVSRQIDVTDGLMVKTIIDALAQDWRPPDIVINSAGIAGGYGFDAMTPDQFDRVINVNLYGSYHVAAAAMPWLEQSKGHLALVASMAGLVGSYGYTSYGASKYGVIGFAECLRIEARPKGVRVSVLCPPEVETPLVIEERRTMPAAGQFLKKYAGSASLDSVSDCFVRGIAADKFLLVPGVLANLLLLQLRIAPRVLVQAITDWQVKMALKAK